MFFSKSFIESGLTFRFLIHFEFIFVYGIRKYRYFIIFFAMVNGIVFSISFSDLSLLMCRNAHLYFLKAKD